MRKNFFRAMLLALPLFSYLPLSAQNQTDRFAVKPRNTLLVGINVAANGSYDQLSYFYRSEYLHRFGKIFEASLGLGFFNYQGIQMTINYWNGNSNITHEVYMQTSIVSLDVMGYIDIINKRRSIIRFGVGFSTRFDNSLLPTDTYLVKKSSGEFTYTTDYIRAKGIDSGVIVHLGYGYRITPHFTTSISARYYSEGKYVSLSMAGLNFGYSF